MDKEVAKIAGMETLTDQAIATEFLFLSKEGIKNYAKALSEVCTPEVRQELRHQLFDNVKNHEAITNYMIKNGYYYPNDFSKQFEVDKDMTKSVLHFRANMYTENPLDEFRPYEDR